MSQNSVMDRPPTVTAREISDRRLPWQCGQGEADIVSSSSLRMASDCVSRTRRSMFGMMPSNACSSVPRLLPRS